MKRFLAGSTTCGPRARGDKGRHRKQTASLSGSLGLWAGTFALAAVLLGVIGFAWAFAAENPTAARTLPPRIPEMSTAGKVLEVSETVLKIERALRGKVEIMEFILEKPFPDLAAGDQIKVNYREKDGRNILTRAAPAQKTAVRKAVKKELPREMKPVPAPAGPAAK